MTADYSTTATYLSTGAFPVRNLEPILERAHALGIRQLEVSSDVAHHPDPLGVLQRWAAHFDFLVHNYFPAPARPFVLNLASVDPTLIEASRRHCIRAMGIAAALGAPFYSVHAGFAANPSVKHLGASWSELAIVPRARAVEVFRHSLDLLLSEAERLGLRLLIENNVVVRRNAPDGRNAMLLCAEPDEMIALAEAYRGAPFAYLIDVGHLAVSAHSLGFSAQAALEAILPWVEALHLSDNDGLVDDNRPFGPDAWFIPWLDRLPDAIRVIEAYNLSLDDMRRCYAALGQELQLPLDAVS